MVKLSTPFVSLIFTPLDDAPLDMSRQILITAMARDKQTNSQYSPDGNQLAAVGGPPLLMEPVECTVRLKGAKPQAVNVLDVYGVPDRKAVPWMTKARSPWVDNTERITTRCSDEVRAAGTASAVAWVPRGAPASGGVQLLLSLAGHLCGGGLQERVVVHQNPVLADEKRLRVGDD